MSTECLARSANQKAVLYPLGRSNRFSRFERPLIDWIYKTDNPDLVESYLHAHFKLRWQWINHAPGKEWFHIAPVEAIAVLRDMEKVRKGLVRDAP